MSSSRIETLPFKDLSTFLALLDLLLDNPFPENSPWSNQTLEDTKQREYFEKLTDSTKIQNPPTDSHSVDLSTIASFQAQLLQASSFDSALDAANLKLGKSDTADLKCCTLVLRHQDTNAILNREQLLEQVKMVENALEPDEVIRSQLFDITKRVTESIGELVGELCPFIDSKRLKEFAVTKTVELGDFMMRFENSWEAMPQDGQLRMPDYAGWRPSLCNYVLKRVDPTRRRLGRLWRNAFFQCVSVPCHEVLHLLQHITAQSATLQSSEHDGAFSTYSMAVALSYRDELSDIVFPGCMEQMLQRPLQIAQSMVSNKEIWTPENKTSYIQWRDSFGIAEKGCLWKENGHFDSYDQEAQYKHLLACEAVTAPGYPITVSKKESDAFIVAMCHTMFMDRTGDICQQPVHVREPCNLSTMTPSQRFSSVFATIGHEAGTKLLDSLTNG